MTLHRIGAALIVLVLIGVLHVAAERGQPASQRSQPGTLPATESAVSAQAGEEAQPTETSRARGTDLLVSADWLAAHLDSPKLVVVHVGSEQEYAAGHIPGARLLPMSAFTWPGEPRVDVEVRPVPELQEALERIGISDDSRIVIYASRPIPAARLWMTLDYLGHGEHASLLDGGLPAWTAAGHRVTAEVPSAARGRLTPRPRPEVLVQSDWIESRLDDPRVVLVDSRPLDEFTGADGGMGGMAHPGHIPGARHMYWEELIAGGDRPVFLDRDALRAKFEAAGAGQDRTVVAYCMVGLRASVTYFVSRLLGYETRFYDGSWHDWGTNKDLPYESGLGRGSPR